MIGRSPLLLLEKVEELSGDRAHALAARVDRRGPVETAEVALDPDHHLDERIDDGMMMMG